MDRYSRQSPSPRYTQLLALYQQLHAEGEQDRGFRPADTFDGQSVFAHVDLIGQLVRHLGARTLLDYGAGKGTQYGPHPFRLPNGTTCPDIPTFWGVRVSCYDPGNDQFSVPPARASYDAVISTDVVEHCAEEDLDWIVDEMFSAATRLVYINAANYPAAKILPNGENAHITLHPLPWWNALVARVAARHPHIHWLLCVQEIEYVNGKARARSAYAGNIRIG